MTEAPLSRYRSRKLLAEGRGALVCEATDETCGKRVILKVARDVVAAGSVFDAQLAHEAELLPQLDHPNVVRQLASGRDEQGRAFVVVEQLDGFSLSTWIRELGELRLDVALALGLRLAEALGYLHERGLVHRDVTPSNVVVSFRGELKLIDFGMACVADGEHGNENEPAVRRATAYEAEIRRATGSPSYAAPEQILGGPVDARADVFSLGVTLYEALCRALPWTRHASHGNAWPAPRGAMVPLRERRPSIPRAVESLVSRSLEPGVTQRPASARVVAQELEACLRQETREAPEKLLQQVLSTSISRPNQPQPPCGSW